MANAVTFNYTTWTTRYPVFGPSGATPVAEPLAQLYFNEAGLYLDNNGCSLVRTDVEQLMLMNMLTAHIAALNAPGVGGAPATPLVGRVSSATQGSVSVSTDMSIEPGSEQWYAQTQYGFAYWNATAQYRTMQFVPGPISVPANQDGLLWSGYGRGQPWRRR